VLKNQTPCTYVWRHKDVKVQRVDHVATRLPRTLAYGWGGHCAMATPSDHKNKKM